MFLDKQKVGLVLKLFAREFVTATEKREHAKRKQTALSLRSSHKAVAAARKLIKEMLNV
jgi:hypothetical protein